MPRRPITYTYRGRGERPTKRGYAWREVYSETSERGFALHPWMTKRECQRDASRRGGKAVFNRSYDTNAVNPT